MPRYLSLSLSHALTLSHSHTPLDPLSSCVVVCGGLLLAPITSLAARLVLIGFVMQSEAQGASRRFWYLCDESSECTAAALYYRVCDKLSGGVPADNCVV